MKPTISLTRRSLLSQTLAVSALAYTGLGPGRAYAQAEKLSGTLTHTITGASNGVIQNKYLWDPFAAEYGIDHAGVSLGADGQVPRLLAEKDNPSIDLYIFVNGQERYISQAGLYHPIPNSGVVAGMPESTRGPDGAWQQISMNLQGLVYRSDKMPKPTSLDDLFKPDYARHILIPRMGSTFGTSFAIMLARHLGGDENNMDPAFKKMKELVAAGAIISTGPGDIPKHFDNDIWLMWYDHSMALQLRQKGIPVDVAFVDQGIPDVGSTAVIVKNAKNPKAAEAFVNFALRPEIQATMWEQLGWWPRNPAANLANIPAGFPTVEEIAAKTVKLDGTAIYNNGSAWRERWDREVAN